MDRFCFDCSRYGADAHLLPFREVGHAFTAVDIATLIDSCDKNTTIGDASIQMMEESLEERYSDWFLLVKDEERTVGWLCMEDLDNDGTDDGTVPLVPIQVDEVVPSSMPLLDLLPVFERHYAVLVLTGNAITHVLSFQDFDKLPGHICLFSLFAELELEMTARLTRMLLSGTNPLETLPEGRLAKARELYALKYPTEEPKELDRQRLLQCTNLIDKVTMIRKDQGLAAKLNQATSGSAKNLLKTVERLRNHVAHGSSLFEDIRSPQELNQLVTEVEAMISTLSEPSSL